MSERLSRLEYLLNQYASGYISPAEEFELFELIDKIDNSKTESVLTKILEQTEPVQDRKRRQRLLKSIIESPELSAERPAAKYISLFSWKRIAVAASVVFVIGLGGYFIFHNTAERRNESADNTISLKDVQPPVANRAMIQLANGQNIFLDSASNGKLMQLGGVAIVKLAGGKIAYRGSSNEMEYNTLVNPKGSKVIDITLADGSKVWLNAGSSVTYPVAFAAQERKVSVTGEAYFEVNHDASKPFIVNTKDVNIQVLGTDFNVNTYDDETDIKVTLLQGSVKVSRENNSLLIKPGQQAVIHRSGDLSLKKDIGTEEITAWKNGRFIFNGTGIESIMKQVSKWYDVEVVYNGKISKETFSGVLNRNGNLSQIIPLLKAGGVKCKIEDKKITVSE